MGLAPPRACEPGRLLLRLLLWLLTEQRPNNRTLRLARQLLRLHRLLAAEVLRRIGLVVRVVVAHCRHTLLGQPAASWLHPLQCPRS